MDTPSSRLVAAAARETRTRDSIGRELTLRRLDALDRLRLFKAVGADLSLNTPYLGMALLALSVIAIDEIPVPTAITEDQLESLVQRLGDAGLSAVADAMEASDQTSVEATDPGN